MTASKPATGATAPPHAGRWQVRIRDASDLIRGCGVLVSERHVVTCAHVLGTGPAMPDEDFILDFPRSGHALRLTARVAADGWLPQLHNGQRDIAVLELDGEVPGDIRPASLGHGAPCLGNAAKVFGHPASIPDGVWTDAEIADSAGPGAEWLQLNAPAYRGERVEAGFSGGGVIDVATQRVVGIVVTAYQPRDRPVAWMIPMEVVAAYWTNLRPLLPGPGRQQPEDRLDDAALDELIQFFQGYQAMRIEEGRRQVAGRLPEVLRPAVPVPSVAALARACSRRPDMRLLADLVRFYEGVSARGGELDSTLRRHGVGPAPTSAEQPESLTVENESRLILALLELPRFQNASTRHAYIETFRRRLRDDHQVELAMRPSDDAPTDARALIRACLPIPGSLRLFTDVIPPVDHAQNGYGALLFIVEALCTVHLLTEAERDELVAILRAVPDKVLKEGHRRAAPPAGPRDGDHDDPERLVRRLESYSQVPGHLPRIITFTEFVARQRPDVQEQLHRWADVTAARLRFLHTDVATVRRAQENLPAVRQPPVLVVQVTPDALDAERFLLTVTLQHDGGPQRVIDLVDEAQPLPDLVTRLNGLFGTVERLLDFEIDDFTVEVILPRSLITERVDQWLVTDIIDEPMGSRYRVVLRSLERLRIDMLHVRWRIKWRLAAEQTQLGAHVMHYVPAGRSPAAAEVRAALQPDDKLMLAMGEPPARHRDVKLADAYAGGLSSGVAYIAWVRNPALSDAFRGALAETLRSRPVRDLPDVVHQWRRDPGRAGLGTETSLMVCDETRIPDQFTGRAPRPPAKRGQP